MVCGSHAKTRAMYSTPPCPSLATSTAAYRRRSFSDSQPKNRFIFCSTSAEYPSMPHSLIRGLLCSKDTAAQAIREVILDHILIGRNRGQTGRPLTLQELQSVSIKEMTMGETLLPVGASYAEVYARFRWQ